VAEAAAAAAAAVVTAVIVAAAAKPWAAAGADPECWAAGGLQDAGSEHRLPPSCTSHSQTLDMSAWQQYEVQNLDLLLPALQRRGVRTLGCSPRGDAAELTAGWRVLWGGALGQLGGRTPRPLGRPRPRLVRVIVLELLKFFILLLIIRAVQAG
jgi:hypothetical protein